MGWEDILKEPNEKRISLVITEALDSYLMCFFSVKNLASNF